MRLDNLDFIRGVALLGILLVNINGFAMPGSAFATPFLWVQETPLDFTIFSLNAVLIQGKFVALFALLFGAGMMLQTRRLARRGRPVTTTYLRRQAALLAIGLIHGCLIWYGDILTVYAAAGIIVFFLRDLSVRWLAGLAVVAFAFPLLFCYPVASGLAALDGQPIEGLPASFDTAAGIPYDPDRHLSDIIAETPLGLSLQAHLYRDGTYLEILPVRAANYAVLLLAAALLHFLKVIGWMLLGATLMKAGFFHRPGRFPRLRLWFFLALGAGLALSAAILPLVYTRTYGAMVLSGFLLAVAALGITPGYLALLARLGSARWAAPFRLAGRQALSNYLGHSVLGTFLFYGYGLGWYGSMGYARLALVALGIYATCVVATALWSLANPRGPVETLWRTLTYLSFSPDRAVGGRPR